LLGEMGPDRRQAVKADAIASPIRGFGRDCLPALWKRLVKQPRADVARGAPSRNKDREACGLSTVM